jgi:hypothetical protein
VASKAVIVLRIFVSPPSLPSGIARRDCCAAE